MRQCPVCKSETGDEPVCPVCGFDISCDYGRFPTLGTGIPRDLKARALQRVKDAKDDAVETEGPTGAPEQTADEPPVSLLSQKKAAARIGTRGAIAGIYAWVASEFSCLFYIMLAHIHLDLSVLTSDSETILRVLFALFLFFGLPFIILKLWSEKKMKPDEWVWKKQSDGKWIVLKKDAPSSGHEKKMLTALLLFCFGGMLGLDILYLNGFSKKKWKLIIRFLISWAAFDSLWHMMNAAIPPEDMPIWADITMGISFLAWFLFALCVPLVRILELPPVFEKGEY